MKSRQTSFPLGCYAGCLISETPSDYLKWVFEEDDKHFGDEIKDIAKEEYDFRTTMKAHWKGYISTYEAFPSCK